MHGAFAVIVAVTLAHTLLTTYARVFLGAFAMAVTRLVAHARTIVLTHQIVTLLACVPFEAAGAKALAIGCAARPIVAECEAFAGRYFASFAGPLQRTFAYQFR